MNMVRKPDSNRGPQLARSARRPRAGSGYAAGCGPVPRRRRGAAGRPRPRWSRPAPAAGSPGSWRPRTAGTRSAATTPARPARPAPASGADTAAPTMPDSEIRPLALTRVKSRGSSRGTAAARVTPYALDATSTPSAAGKSQRRLGDRRRRRAPSTGTPGAPSSRRSPTAGRGAKRSRNGPISGATIANGSIVSPRNSATWPRASPVGTWKNSVPASEIATAASPAVLKTCSWISRDSPVSPAPSASVARRAVTHRVAPGPAGAARGRAEPARDLGAGPARPTGPAAPGAGRASAARRSTSRTGGVLMAPILPASTEPRPDTTRPMGHDFARDHRPRAPRPTPSPWRRSTWPARPSSRRSTPPTSASTSVTSPRASGSSPTCSPARAPATSAGAGPSPSPARRAEGRHRRRGRAAARRRARSSPRRGCPTASGSSPATSPPATCCRSTTTTRGWSRRTPSATTRSTPTTRRRSATSPRTSASAGSACSPSRAATWPPSAGTTATAAPTSPLAQARRRTSCTTCGFLVRLAGPLSEAVRRLRQRRRQRRRPGRLLRPRLRRALRGAAGQEARAAAAAGPGPRHADRRRGRDVLAPRARSTPARRSRAGARRRRQ